MTRRSLRFRLLAAAAVSITLALLVAGIGLAALFERHVERRVEAQLDDTLRQILAHLTATPEGRIHLDLALADPRYQTPLSGLYWQIQDEDRPTLLRSRSLWDAVLDLPDDRPRTGSCIATSCRVREARPCWWWSGWSSSARTPRADMCGSRWPWIGPSWRRRAGPSPPICSPIWPCSGPRWCSPPGSRCASGSPPWTRCAWGSSPSAPGTRDACPPTTPTRCCPWRRRSTPCSTPRTAPSSGRVPGPPIWPTGSRPRWWSWPRMPQRLRGAGQSNWRMTSTAWPRPCASGWTGS